ncbi:16S rRNA (cytidine(1402)-2'-O)-methyltransferase [Tardibacter chloracetimidivorans]|uniref:Ribosomal RNA small subunit methyltransferase I n=1 Tax=Tardibacter chloracetimidivorans TaxID=1921510 RepID=A0A1L3ZZN4_9SPHN|nr:16S rRNA (cytidine(1402)-2'-O)-methyltransferase [Tardibacter chloracetimidivorans]API61049.1 16S rRNA (cytidine(1402)-2'-O)-methyltransferase [Tardibacter chloracetimidivorans]
MSQTSDLKPGLYIVATPIGNLGELSPRAADILARASAIAVEDSRVTATLMRHIGAKRPMIPYHDHNADQMRPELLNRLSSEAIALVSDAGTPLISDPGFKLVREARAAGHYVTTISGPCAAIAALTVAGLPTDRFMFAGFLPAKALARETELAELAGIRATLIFYESPHRLAATLAAMATVLGDREAAVTRELTKKFEEVVTGRLGELAIRYAESQPKGEIVLVVGPPAEAPPPSADDLDALLLDRLATLSVKDAAAAVAESLNLPRKQVYERALLLKDRKN